MNWTSLAEVSPHCFSHLLLTNGKKIWVDECWEDHGGWDEEEYPTHFIYINEFPLPDGSKIKKNDCKEKDCHCDSIGCSYLPVMPSFKQATCDKCNHDYKIVKFGKNHLLEKMCFEHWEYKTFTPFDIKQYYIEAYQLKEIKDYFKIK